MINFNGYDTIFYYKVDGTLRQALKIWINNRTGKPQSGAVTVFVNDHEPVTTLLPVISEGRRSYTVFAPVIYPNFKPLISYGAGRHSPVRARVELKVGSQTITKSITIGRWRPWTIYVCQDVCTDFTWGHKEDETINLSVNLTKAHLKMIKATEGKSFESQNRWNINQTMEVMWFMERETSEKIKELFKREKDDHISISPIYNSCLTSTMSTEQAIRSLYFARELEKKYGIDLSVVEHIEVPTIAWGMATIFAGAGIKYFVKAWLNFMAPFCNRRDDIPLFYWEGPDGSKVLTASDKAACLRAAYAQASFLFKPYRKAVKELHEWWIPHFENHSEYPYDAFILLGSHGDLGKHSAKQIARLVFNIIRYNSEPWEYPKIVNANWKHFFKHIEDFIEKHGVTPPVLRGDFGCSWEEWPAHLAAVFSRVRRGVNAFVTAEKLVALASLLEDEVYVTNRNNLRVAQMRMVQIAEHPWNGSNPVERVDAYHRKLRWEKELNKKVDEVIENALDVISRHVPTEAETTLLVFNPLSWRRTDIVRVEAPSSGPFQVIDNDTGESLPNNIIDIEGKPILTFVARNVPPLGYKTYTVLRANRVDFKKSSIVIKGNVIENQFYRVEVDEKTGGILRIFDKKRKKEMVDIKSKYKLNQYVYLSEGEEYTPINAKISLGHHGFVSGSLIIESSTMRSKIRTIITLYSDLDRIDITNEVEKTPTSELQEIHFVFPFNIPDRVYHYEATAAIIKPGLAQYGGEQLRGSGQSSHACQSFVDVSNEEYGVILSQIDSYLIQFGHRTTFEDPEFPDPLNSTIWSLIMLNKCPEMLADQGGISNFTFRYSIKGHDGKIKGSEAIRFGWERNNDLLVKVLNPNQKGDLPSKSHSFLSCKPQNVVVTTLKVAEEGIKKGLIVRLWEADGKATETSLDISNIGAVSAVRTDLLERDQKKLKIFKDIVSVPIPARGITTIRLLLDD